MFVFYSKGKKKMSVKKERKLINQPTNQPTANHPKMTVAGV